MQYKAVALTSPCRQTTTSRVRGEALPCCPSVPAPRLPVPRFVLAPRPDAGNAGGPCSPHAGKAELAGSMVMSARHVQHVQRPESADQPACACVIVKAEELVAL